MAVIKLDIEPSFIASGYLLLEQKDDNWLFTFCKKGSNGNNEAEIIWSMTIDNNREAETIYKLADRVITEAKVDHRFCLDGVRVVCNIAEDGMVRSYGFASPEPETTELFLMEAVLELCQKYSTGDEVFTNYIELLEGYFTSKLPVKIDEGQPLRVKFYGSLTTHQWEELVTFIDRISQEERLIVDMTNFQGMGTLLYDCFKQLHKIKNLTFIANEEGRRHLTAMGFKV